jgi:formate hydrogenlyase subunit 3/multisubunit Na+/H+ antiporter MnhD subunit
MKRLFNIGIAISCTGLIMLFTYFIGNELLKKLSGVVEFLYLQPLLAVVASTVFIVGLALVIFSWDKISRKH